MEEPKGESEQVAQFVFIGPQNHMIKMIGGVAYRYEV